MTAHHPPIDAGRVTVGYPSDDFPGPPRVQLDVPPDWQGVTSPAAELMVTAPAPVDGVVPRIILTIKRRRSAQDPRAALAALVHRRIESRGIEPAESVHFGPDDHPAYTVRFVVEADDGTPTEYRQVYQYRPAARIAHIVILTGSYAPGSEQGRDLVEAILDSAG